MQCPGGVHPDIRRVSTPSTQSLESVMSRVIWKENPELGSDPHAGSPLMFIPLVFSHKDDIVEFEIMINSLPRL